MFSVEKKIERKKKIHNRKKNVLVKNTNTLESHYREKVEYFSVLQENLPKLITKFNKVKDPNEKKLLSIQIEDIKLKKEEVEYYMKVGSLIFEYEELNGDTQEEHSKRLELSLSYFQKLHLPVPKYLDNLLKIDMYSCENCNKTGNIIERDGYAKICSHCGSVSKEQVINDGFNIETKENYSLSNIMSKGVSYERIKYFEEWLKQIQAKENICINQDTIDLITLEIKKEKIKDLSNIKIPFVKKILKKINLSHHYSDIPYIIYKINNLPPLVIPYEIELKFKNMFIEVQYIWEANKKEFNRHNFFSYPYTLHKFCQLLGLKEYIKYFPLLKSREKLYKQDLMWKKIIEEINKSNQQINPVIKDIKWIFIASV